MAPKSKQKSYLVIVSNDSIMKPPYDLTTSMLKLVASISEKIGAVNAIHLHKPEPRLRKKNRVQTIRASLAIEGNQLSEAQVTAILENKRVLGPKKDIQEVLNAIAVYEQMSSFKPTSIKSFLKAHKILMKGLIEKPGSLRKKGVGIVKGNKVSHVAPPAANLNFLMKDLFNYLKNEEDPVLIKSCVLHYEIEFIHPFMDGNGRMGRLWQTLTLMNEYPIFEYLPFETIIKDRQDEYYAILEHCDKEGKSTKFIEFMLDAINRSLGELLKNQFPVKSQKDRIDYFLATYKKASFTRKDYLEIFKEISTATASRDLKYGLEKKRIQKEGEKRNTIYKIIRDEA